MNINKSKKFKKLLTFTPEEWSKIEDYRFMNRINTQSDAIKELIQLGLQYCRTSFANTANEIKHKYGELFKKFE